MLSWYDGRPVRLTTEDGAVFTGTPEAVSSGYGLHVFGREEESLRFDDTYVFLSEIRRLELLSNPAGPAIRTDAFDGLIETLLEVPYRIVDILPEQVPVSEEGQYFAVARYFMQPERLMPLRRKMAAILLRLNGYYDMAVSFDGGASWEKNPDPEAFAGNMEHLPASTFLRAIFPSRRVMIDVDFPDTYMTVSGSDPGLLDKLGKLAAAEGFFLWEPMES